MSTNGFSQSYVMSSVRKTTNWHLGLNKHSWEQLWTNCEMSLGTKLGRQWPRKLGMVQMGGSAEITLGQRTELLLRSLMEHSQHISHMQRLETTRSGLPPSFRWKWTSSRWNKAIFNSPFSLPSRPPVMCPVNGLWVYSTAGSPQRGHK